MARRPEPNQAEEALHEIEESFDRLARWVSENRVMVVIVTVGILGLAAGADLYRGFQARTEDRAAQALAEVRNQFMIAMGADPGDLVFEEPANPAVARSARETFVKRFEAVGEEHEGSAAAALALLQAGNLHAELGAPHLALDAWTAGLASAKPGTPLEALLQQRVARAQEDAGDWAAAAAAHERAARIQDYPGRWEALADAARCRMEAGEAEAALALFAELEAAAVIDQIPPYTVARLRELRARRSLGAEG